MNGAIIGAAAGLGLLYLLQRPGEQAETCDMSAACQEERTWLDQRVIDWQPASYQPMNFSAPLMSLQSFGAPYGSEEFDDLFLDLLMYDMNVDIVYMAILPQSWDDLAIQSRYIRAAQKIRAAGKKLNIAYVIGNFFGQQPTFDHVPTYTEYLNKELQYLRSWIPALNPDYVFVLDEPRTMNSRLKTNWGPLIWSTIVRESAGLVKSLSPGTKVGASIALSDGDIYISSRGITSVDIWGMNIYGSPDTRACLDDPLCYSRYFEDVKTIGKEPWILETWQDDILDVNFDKPWKEELDSKWIRALAYFAQIHGAKNIMPFYTNKFVTNEPLKNKATALNSIYNGLITGQRTERYYEYVAVMQEVRNPPI